MKCKICGMALLGVSAQWMKEPLCLRCYIWSHHEIQFIRYQQMTRFLTN